MNSLSDDIPPFVDSHVHFWNPQRLRYGWLAGEPSLNKKHEPPELAQAATGLPLDKIVFVQCDCDPAQAAEEATYVAELARTESRIKGIVAFAAVERGRVVAPHLDLLRNNPLVKGVRRLLQGEKDAEKAVDERFVEGVRLLHGYGWTFDICIVAPQLPTAVRLVKSCPNVRFVLDHAGKPLIAKRERQPWEQHLRELSKLPNVVAKLSGLATEADRKAWTSADLKPYADHLLACFGPDRVLFGGDWPVCTPATPYRRWAETVADLLGDLPAGDRLKVWRTNAERVYNL